MKIPVGNLLLFWKLFRETNFQDIDQSAKKPVRLAVTGETPADRHTIIETLSRGGDASVFAADPAAAHSALAISREFGSLQAQLTKRDDTEPAPPIMLPGLAREHIEQQLAQHLAVSLDEDAILALARRLPTLRDAAGQRLIWEASSANAQFATVTNIADIVPILGPFVATVADLIVLTKNQVMLVYKLAAIHGKPLGSKRAIAAEIAPVLGSAFVWRSLARSAAGLAPFGLGIIPKVAIAFGGTFAVGQAAHYYFSTGRKPPKALVHQFYTDALAKAKHLAPKPSPAAQPNPAAGNAQPMSYPLSTNGASHGQSLSNN